MAVTSRGTPTSGNGAAATPTSFATTFPATPNADDIAVIIGHVSAATITMSLPAGWNAPSGITNPTAQSTNQRTYVWWKRLTASEAAPTITNSGSTTGGWECHLLAGANLGATPVRGLVEGTAAVTSRNLPSLTGCTANSLLIAGATARVASGTIPTGITPNASYTETRDHATSRSTAGQNIRMETAERAIATSGTFGGESFSVTNSISSSMATWIIEVLEEPTDVPVADSDTATVTDTEAQSQEQSDTASIAEAESSSATLSDTESVSVNDAESQGQDQSDSVTLADAESVSQADSDVISVADAEAISLSDTDTFIVADNQAQSVADTDALVVIDAESIAAQASDTETLTVADAQEQGQSQPDTLSIADAEALAQSQTDALAVAETEQQSQADVDTAAVADAESIAATLSDAETLNILDQGSEPGIAPEDKADSDSLSFVEAESILVTDSDTLSVADAQAQSLAEVESLSVADAETQSMSDTDLHTVSDTQQQDQSSSETFTLADVEAFAATLQDTDPFNIVDLESLDAGDPPLEVSDSDTLGVSEDESVALSNTDTLTIADAQATGLTDSDTAVFLEGAEQFAAALSSSDTLPVSDTQSIDRGSPPQYAAIAQAGSALITSLTGGSQLVRAGATTLEVGVGGMPIQIETDNEL